MTRYENLFFEKIEAYIDECYTNQILKEYSQSKESTESISIEESQHISAFMAEHHLIKPNRFEIVLLAASSECENNNTSLPSFNTAVNDVFRVIFNHEDCLKPQNVFIDLVPIKGKEIEFHDYFSLYKSKRRKFNFYYENNKNTVVVEGELVHSSDGMTVAGSGKFTHTKRQNEDNLKLYLEISQPTD